MAWLIQRQTAAAEEAGAEAEGDSELSQMEGKEECQDMEELGAGQHRAAVLQYS